MSQTGGNQSEAARVLRILVVRWRTKAKRLGVA
ncbi:MAG: hypothetical protein H6721_31160 [Sandaracinus sp.]|nr:hypothetical protein [Sandaracinus sp.]